MIHVRLFGGLAERAGTRTVAVAASDATTVADLRESLARQIPGLADVLERCQVAVDLEVANPATTITGDSEVAVLPPVAGGSGPSGHSEPRIPPGPDATPLSRPATRQLTINGREVVAVTGLVRPPIATDEVLRAIGRPSTGATVSFLGTVRDHAGDLDGVVRLEYSAYPEMAERQLAQIADELAEQHRALIGLALLHTIGSLPVGAHTILIACASAHRAEAFDACRDALERVKQQVAVWKKEHTADGASRWVGLEDSASP